MLIEGYDYSDSEGPVPVVPEVDGGTKALKVSVASIAVPGGISTSAKQDDQTVVLNQILGAIGALSGGGMNVIYREGEPAPSGNIYSSWTTALAAAQLSRPCQMVIDSSLGSGQVTPGIFDITNIQLRGVDGSVPSFLGVADGATFLGWGGAEMLIITSFSAAPIFEAIAPTSGGFTELNFGRGALLQAEDGAAPPIHVAGGIILLIGAQEGATLGDATNPVLGIDGGGLCEVFLYSGSAISDNATAGDGELDVVSFSASSAVGAQPDITTLNIELLTEATEVAYLPPVPGRWAPVPEIVSTALDQLSNRIDKLFWGADALIDTTPVLSKISPGSRATSVRTPNPAYVYPTIGCLSTMYVQHVGNVLNVSGQTIMYELRIDGAVWGSITLAANAGVKSGNVFFTPGGFDIGTAVTLTATPSAALTASPTDIAASAA